MYCSDLVGALMRKGARRAHPPLAPSRLFPPSRAAAPPGLKQASLGMPAAPDASQRRWCQKGHTAPFLSSSALIDWITWGHTQRRGRAAWAQGPLVGWGLGDQCCARAGEVLNECASALPTARRGTSSPGVTSRPEQEEGPCEASAQMAPKRGPLSSGGGRAFLLLPDA